jgi:hypothetical protein
VRPGTDDLAAYIGGFVAAEGTFTSWRSPTKARWTFAVGLGASDRSTCELLHTFFGVGHVTESPRRKAHYDDEVTYSIQSLRDHLAVTIPFMDEHLPESYKRRQYLAWRAELLDYWEHSAKRRRPCTVDGCDSPRRAHGVCRRHLWLLHRQ